MTHVKEILFQTVSEYLNTTTIHGFAYVQKSRNVLERLSWCVIILGCISFSGLLIRQSLNEAEEHPIATTVELVPLTSVPFPAVPIDSDPNFNLWGFTQKLFNMLTFYEADNEEINDKSKQLKTDFSFVQHPINTWSLAGNPQILSPAKKISAHLRRGVFTQNINIETFIQMKSAKILTVEVKTVKTKLMTPFHKIGSKVPFRGDTLNAYNAG